MSRKYRLFDCKTEISISLNAQLNIERRRHGVMLTLRRQQKLLTGYKRMLVSTIKRVKAKTEFVVRERSQELYEFLLKNNEPTQKYINEYRADQESKVQLTVQYYGAFIGPDLKDIQLPGCEEKSEVKLTNLLKVVNSVLEMIEMRIQMVNQGEGKNDAEALAKFPIHRFIVMQPHRFQHFPSNFCHKFKSKTA